MEIGIDRFKAEACRSELDKSGRIDLAFNLNDFVEGLETGEKTSHVSDSTKENKRVEDGKNYYGVIKNGNQYMPSLKMQDEVAFNRVNLSTPFMGLDEMEEPTFLLSEFYTLLGLQYNLPNVEVDKSGSMGCKIKSYENIQKIILTKITPLGEKKTIDAFLLLYATSGQMLINGKICISLTKNQQPNQ